LVKGPFREICNMVFALRGPSASRQEFARRNLGSALTQVDTDELAVYGSRTKPGACQTSR